MSKSFEFLTRKVGIEFLVGKCRLRRRVVVEQRHVMTSKERPMSAFVRKGRETQQQSTVQDLFNSFFRFGEIHNFPVLSVFLLNIIPDLSGVNTKMGGDCLIAFSRRLYGGLPSLAKKLYYSSFFPFELTRKLSESQNGSFVRSCKAGQASRARSCSIY